MPHYADAYGRAAAAEAAAAEAEYHYRAEREHHLDMAARYLHSEEPMAAIIDRLVALEVESALARLAADTGEEPF